MLLQKSSCFPFAFKTLDISQGSVVTHFMCDGYYFSPLGALADRAIYYYKFSSDSDSFVNRFIFDKFKAYKNCAKFLDHSVYTVPLLGYVDGVR